MHKKQAFSILLVLNTFFISHPAHTMELPENRSLAILATAALTRFSTTPDPETKDEKQPQAINVSKKRTLTCDVCGHKAKSQSLLTRHRYIHIDKKPFTCDQCTYSTPQRWVLKRHKLTHTGDRPFACSICKYKCRQRYHLKEHIRNHHE